MSPALAQGNAARGGQIFKTTCALCHFALSNASRADAATRIGPNLFGVVGRKAGKAKDFGYSQALKNSGITWTHDTLKRYIAAPQKVIPNVRMNFAGLHNAQDIDDVIAYLDTLK